MTHLPDPLRFVARSLEAQGALVDLGAGRASAVLPLQLATSLALPDAVDLGEGGTRCDLGSPLLEALVEGQRRATPVVVGRSALLPPRESAVRALAGSFAVRNGVADLEHVGFGETWYLCAALAWRVDADERYEGLVVGAVEPTDGGVPPIPVWEDAELADVTVAPSVDVGTAARWVTRLAARHDDVGAAPIAASQRRHQREHDRVVAYYRELAAEARRPRRKVDPASIEEKVVHLRNERDGRLADLRQRYGVTTTVRLGGLLWVGVPVGVATLRARRRNGARTLSLRLCPGARAFDALPCDGCEGWAEGGVALCDDQLHVLCARCVPEASGRPRCRACQRPPR